MTFESIPMQGRREPRFAGRSVLVVGGSSGIGLACAEQFALEGGRVIVTGRDPDHIHSARERLGADNVIRADVSSRIDRKAVIELVAARRGRIDVLVATAGVPLRKSFFETTETDWDTVMETNLKGLYFTVQSAVPLMAEGASVVLTTSLATERPHPARSVYAASKAGLSSVTRTLGGELVSRGIRVNEVRPGPIYTAMTTKLGMTGEALTLFRDKVANSVPMRRWGTAAEVAKAILFLASDEASFITGATLAVDGGASSFF